MVSERTTLEAFGPASRTQKTTRLRQVRIAKRSYSEPPFHRPHTEARGAATYSGLSKLGSGGGEGGVGPGQNCLAQWGPGNYYTPWQDTDAAEANSRRTAPGTCHGGASGPAGSSPSRTTTPSNLRRTSWSTSGERRHCPLLSGCFSSARVHRRRGRTTWNVGGEQPPFPSACSDGGFC
ncbi:unnamed protein product [Nyctereutes procyonoides]|uniref:(raccoon dog) hypothetical protein n=1 Tax=Nyctereutes procyonoides TaxID=34880 RepID=A0A811ZU50_NYCPR|nr:unnamed protein product [Nyctereutes procyonoides]